MTTDHFPKWKATEFLKQNFHDQFDIDRALLLKATEGLVAFPTVGRFGMFASADKKEPRLQVEDKNIPTPGGKLSK